jgi:hypothetical protein
VYGTRTGDHHQPVVRTGEDLPDLFAGQLGGGHGGRRSGNLGTELRRCDQWFDVDHPSGARQGDVTLARPGGRRIPVRLDAVGAHTGKSPDETRPVTLATPERAHHHVGAVRHVCNILRSVDEHRMWAHLDSSSLIQLT